MPEPIEIHKTGMTGMKRIKLETVNHGAAADIFKQYLATIEEDLKSNESEKARTITLKISFDRKDVESGFVNVVISGSISLPKLETMPLKAKASSLGITQELSLDFGD